MKKQRLILWIGIVLIGCLILSDLLVFHFNSMVKSAYISIVIIFVAKFVIAYLRKHNLDKRTDIKAKGRLYFKEITRKYGNFGRIRLDNKLYIFKIEVGPEMLEFFVSPDLYDSVEKGNKVYLGYDLVGEDYRWINWIEPYR